MSRRVICRSCSSCVSLLPSPSGCRGSGVPGMQPWMLCPSQRNGTGVGIRRLPGLARIIRQRNSLAVSQVGTPCQSVRRSSSGGAPSRDGGFAGGGRGSRCRIPSPASVPSERSASPPAELSAFPATVSGDAACRRRRQTPFSGAPGRGGRFRSGLCMTVNLIGLRRRKGRRLYWDIKNAP